MDKAIKFFVSLLKEKNIVNIPNILSLYRIIASPFMYIFAPKSIVNDYYYILNFIVILSIIVSDFLDGFLSRIFNISTVFGKYIDALADKIALFFAVITFYSFYGLSFFIIIVVIIRETIIIIFTFRAAEEDKSIKTTGISKVAFFSFSVLFILYYIREIPQIYKDISLTVTVILYLSSLYGYIMQHIELQSNKKRAE